MLTDSLNEERLECVLYACKGVHTLFTGQRESERKREREKEEEREREKERKREREKESIYF
jgi:hypothetical protein